MQIAVKSRARHQLKKKKKEREGKKHCRFSGKIKDTVFPPQILRCISQLELAQLIGTGVKPKHMSKDTGAVHPIEAFDPEGERADFGGGLVLVCVLAGSLLKLLLWGMCAYMWFVCVCMGGCGCCVCVVYMWKILGCLLKEL